MNKYWICAASPSYIPQMNVLRDSVTKYAKEYTFVHVPISGEIKSGALARMGKALDLLQAGAAEVVISGADYWLLKGPAFYIYKEDCLFCPHFFEMPSQASPAWSAMRAGVINCDLQVWRNTEWTKGFLNSVIEAVREATQFRDIFEYEQSWMPFALAAANGGFLSSSHGVAYYNLHERELVGARSIHFSGWKSDNPKALSRYGCSRDLTPSEQAVVNSYAIEVAKYA